MPGYIPGEIRDGGDPSVDLLGGFMEGMYSQFENKRQAREKQQDRNRQFLGPLILQQMMAGNTDILGDPGFKKYFQSMGFPKEMYQYLLQIAGSPQVQAQKKLQASQMQSAQKQSEAQALFHDNMTTESERGLPGLATPKGQPVEYGESPRGSVAPDTQPWMWGERGAGVPGQDPDSVKMPGIADPEQRERYSGPPGPMSAAELRTGEPGRAGAFGEQAPLVPGPEGGAGDTGPLGPLGPVAPGDPSGMLPAAQDEPPEVSGPLGAIMPGDRQPPLGPTSTYEDYIRRKLAGVPHEELDQVPSTWDRSQGTPQTTARHYQARGPGPQYRGGLDLPIERPMRPGESRSWTTPPGEPPPELHGFARKPLARPGKPPPPQSQPLTGMIEDVQRPSRAPMSSLGESGYLASAMKDIGPTAARPAGLPEPSFEGKSVAEELGPERALYLGGPAGLEAWKQRNGMKVAEALTESTTRKLDAVGGVLASRYGPNPYNWPAGVHAAYVMGDFAGVQTALRHDMDFGLKYKKYALDMDNAAAKVKADAASRRVANGTAVAKYAMDLMDMGEGAFTPDEARGFAERVVSGAPFTEDDNRIIRQSGLEPRLLQETKDATKVYRAAYEGLTEILKKPKEYDGSEAPNMRLKLVNQSALDLLNAQIASGQIKLYGMGPDATPEEKRKAWHSRLNGELRDLLYVRKGRTRDAIPDIVPLGFALRQQASNPSVKFDTMPPEGIIRVDGNEFYITPQGFIAGSDTKDTSQYYERLFLDEHPGDETKRAPVAKTQRKDEIRDILGSGMGYD